MTHRKSMRDDFCVSIRLGFSNTCLFGLGLAILSLAILAPVTTANANRRRRNAGTLSASGISFGNVMTGSVDTQTVAIRNSGSATVTISAVSVSGTEFSTGSLNLPMTVGGGATLSLAATFAPTAAGSASGTIHITSNASDSSVTIALSGTGMVSSETLTASPNSVTFGDVASGQSTSANIVLTNTGTSAVTISQVTAPGAPYAISGVAANQTISPGQSATLLLSFSPTTTGSFTGTATIASTATNSPLSIAVAGGSHAVSLSWTASSSTVAGYNVYRGTSATGPYTLLNASLIAGTAYTDLVVSSGQSYYYVVTAVNASGVESAYSNQAPATIPTP